MLQRFLGCCFGGGGGGGGGGGDGGSDGGGGVGGGGDGLVWDMALKPHATGVFSIAVAQANEALEDQAQVLAAPSATLVGVFDGHGGPEASRFVNARLLSHVCSFASAHGGISDEVLKKAFDATEEEFLSMVKKSWLLRPKIMSVGSCCLVGAVHDGLLYVANLGDSRAVLGHRAAGRKAAVTAERLTRDHNVADEEVRRELAELHPDDSQIVVNHRGVWRVKGIIQVSRSIGDIYLKKPDICKDHPILQQSICPVPLRRAVMTAVPSIKIHKVRPDDLFVIFASDGLWEQLSDEDAVKIVSNNPRNGIAKRLVRAALHEAAKKKQMLYDRIKTIEKGYRRYYHDDITVVVIFLDNCKGAPSKLKGSAVDCTTAPLDIFSFGADDSEDPTRPVLQ